MRTRSFLLACIEHFLTNEWDRARALKRGGGRKPISLEVPSGESRYRLEPVDDLTPEKLFERQWALAVLERVLNRLQTKWNEAGEAAAFERLKGCLAGSQAEAYAGQER